MKRGLFITFEGTDGSGKSTQLKKLCSYLEGKGIDYIITREPGGTAIGEALRNIILDKDNGSMSDETEILLYAASRAQHVREKIVPELDSGKFVICDRFTDSSMAYQGYGRGLYEMTKVINDFATGGLEPDITVLLNLPPEEAEERLRLRGETLDRLESEDMSFKRRVFDGYRELSLENRDRFISIDPAKSIEEIWQYIESQLEVRLKDIQY